MPKKKTNTQAILTESGPKRDMMHMLRKLSAEKLATALNDGLVANHTVDELTALNDRIQKLTAIMKALKSAQPGDVIFLDYLPGQGTRVVFNGEVRGTIAGEDFCKALLKVWLGERPADASLKNAMLGVH